MYRMLAVWFLQLELACAALPGCGTKTAGVDGGVEAGGRHDVHAQQGPDCSAPQPASACGQFVCTGGVWRWTGAVNCSGEGSCGNGERDPNEECDDGNTVGGDGCGMLCQLEAGWECPDPGRPCRDMRCGDDIPTGCDGGAGGFCGDGILNPEQGEECDQGPGNGTTDKLVTVFPSRTFGCSSECRAQPYVF
jgi:cysteine-rich repeat protein